MTKGKVRHAKPPPHSAAAKADVLQEEKSPLTFGRSIYKGI